MKVYPPSKKKESISNCCLLKDNIEKWDCGCSYGCHMCNYRYHCKVCGKYFVNKPESQIERSKK